MTLKVPPVRPRRWILIVFIVLPLSRGLSAYWRLRDFVYDTFLAKPHLHSSRVAEIQRRVKAFRAAGGPKAAGGRLLCTSRPQWLRTTLRQMDYQTSKNAIPIREPRPARCLPPRTSRPCTSGSKTGHALRCARHDRPSR